MMHVPSHSYIASHFYSLWHDTGRYQGSFTSVLGPLKLTDDIYTTKEMTNFKQEHRQTQL